MFFLQNKFICLIAGWGLELQTVLGQNWNLWSFPFKTVNWSWHDFWEVHCSWHLGMPHAKVLSWEIGPPGVEFESGRLSKKRKSYLDCITFFGMNKINIFTAYSFSSGMLCHSRQSRVLPNMTLLSQVWLSAAPRTVACQASLSMGFPRQEY